METMQELKQELLEQITAIDYYDVLLALKEDVALYQTKATEEGPYDFPGATDEEKEELFRLDKGSEINEKNYVSLHDFKEVMNRWRTKYLSINDFKINFRNCSAT